MLKHQYFKGKDLIPFLHNAYASETDEKGKLHLTRFTKKQMERYRFDSNKIGGDFGKTAKACSNITLEFETDSPWFGLDFDWALAVDGCPWFSFDLYVDGILVQHLTDTNPRCHLFAASLPAGMHRIQIFFPWNQNIIINHLAAAKGAAVLPVKKDIRILSFGDSITQGYISEHPSLSYIGCVTRKLNAEVLNQAIGGYYFEEESLDDALKDWDPDLITIAYGINDFSFMTDYEEFRRRCERYVRRISEIFPDKKMLGIMPIYTNNERFRQRCLIREYTFSEAMETIRQAYRQNPNIEIMEDTFFPHTKDFFAPDELHPNDLGFQIYGDAVIERIRSLKLK